MEQLCSDECKPTVQRNADFSEEYNKQLYRSIENLPCERERERDVDRGKTSVNRIEYATFPEQQQQQKNEKPRAHMQLKHKLQFVLPPLRKGKYNEPTR